MHPFSLTIAFLSVLFVWIHISGTTAFTYGLLRAEDSAFLEDFYNAMTNKPNNWNVSFKDSYDNNPCSVWEGVSCEAFPGNASVQGISGLSFNRMLNGIVPASIGNLARLDTVYELLINCIRQTCTPK